MNIKNIRSLISQSLNIAAMLVAVGVFFIGTVPMELRVEIDIVCSISIITAFMLKPDITFFDVQKVIRKLILCCILLAFTPQVEIMGEQIWLQQIPYIVLNYALRAMVAYGAILAWLAQQYESGFEILDNKVYRFAFVTALQIAIIVRWAVHKIQRLFVKPRLGI